MIDVEREELIALSELPRILPKRGRRRLAFSTAWRWATKGAHGVRLETVRCGARLLTSRAALARFMQAQTSADPVLNAPSVGSQPKHRGRPPKPRTPDQRERDVQAAEQRLAEAGI